ncbi:hypothetical protein, unlikely [Trypanosoma brucei brucei TREU927]|uniref:Uncharacterized protein n=1 Tax=Trypanosoma brucei brucei (strain 927/4 GUTat10.1) TaxID=185431 RepID=Q4GYZ9_TRYB2|nr:hypothetical protein, unlikely [Trypanosoma brucei brucei TREU927]CAJ16329.1 hypothetical protein, unlikely [Trypanosoma brucei brucei TREU927]
MKRKKKRRVRFGNKTKKRKGKSETQRRDQAGVLRPCFVLFCFFFKKFPSILLFSISFFLLFLFLFLKKNYQSEESSHKCTIRQWRIKHCEQIRHINFRQLHPSIEVIPLARCVERRRRRRKKKNENKQNEVSLSTATPHHGT